MILNPIIQSSSGGLKPQIIVTAPTGSTVTCTTPGGIVLTAIEISGTWTFANLPGLGTYTINASLGTESKVKSIVIDRIAVFQVSIAYKLYLYNRGDECTDVTGGWGGTGTKYNDSLYIHGKNGGEYSLETNNTIDISAYTELHFIGKVTSIYDGWAGIYINLHPEDVPYYSLNRLGDFDEFWDISSVSGEKTCYLGSQWSTSSKGYFYEIWLE